MSESESNDVIYTSCEGCTKLYTHGSDLDVGDREYCRKCVEAGRRDWRAVARDKQEAESDDDMVRHPHIPGWWIGKESEAEQKPKLVRGWDIEQRTPNGV